MDITFVNSYSRNLECGEQALRDILIPFSEKIKLPFIVENAHGNYVAPNRTKDKVHIYFWSSVSFSEKSLRFPNETTIFGSVVTGCAVDGTQPSSEAINSRIIKIRCPEGHVAAEFHRDRPYSLHILYDLPHQYELNAKIQLAGIMNEYFLLAFNNKRALLELTAKMKEELAKKNRDSDCEIYKLRERLLSVEMMVKDEKRKRINAENSAKELAQKERNEFDKIKKEAKIISSGGKKKIKTASGDTIVFHTDNGFYEAAIGREKIPFHAICAGTAKAGLAQFIGGRQYYAAFKIINRWIQNYKNTRSGK